ncbi:MAG: hypothetical protein JWR15_2723 [Prosthecobacter sp.]|nr:hypothetical protein [Prosthecobacter sp.]
MTTTNSTELRRASGGLGDILAPSQRGAHAWRGSLQTLLVDALCGGVLGLLPGRVMFTQGRLAEARLTLGCITQLRWLVCGGMEGRNGASGGQEDPGAAASGR